MAGSSPMHLARMISAQKWRVHTNIEEGEISADAVTTDLRTSNNTLSFWWHDPSNETSLEDIAVALATGRQCVQRLDIVWLEEEAVKDVDLKIDATPGVTALSELKDAHRDVVGLDVMRLAVLSERIALAVKEDRTIRFTEKQILALIQKAIDAKRIETSALHEDVAKKLVLPLE